MTSFYAKRLRPIGVALALLTAGCAPAYHWYHCGCGSIRYDYCPAAPLPYTTYGGCPTPVAPGYASGVTLPKPGETSPSTPRRGKDD